MRSFILTLVSCIVALNLFAQPRIDLLVPSSAPVGSMITIQGNGFSTSSPNIIFFGAVKANASVTSATQITVQVPAGATYQPVSVTTNGLTGYSPTPFLPTFPNDDPHITASSFSVVGSFPVGQYPFDVTIKDLNDDGRP